MMASSVTMRSTEVERNRFPLAFLDLGRIKEEAKESVEMIFKQVDLNKNQKIDFSEFIAANLQVSMR